MAAPELHLKYKLSISRGKVNAAKGTQNAATSQIPSTLAATE
jgi:hypothetical protein